MGSESVKLAEPALFFKKKKNALSTTVEEYSTNKHKRGTIVLYWFHVSMLFGFVWACAGGIAMFTFFGDVKQLALIISSKF